MEGGRRRIRIGLIFAVLFATLASISVGSVSAATTHYVNPGDSIQDVVDVADPGDTIIVRDGTYTENVAVNVANLTLQSEHGSAFTTVVAAVNTSDVFLVTANSVTITGFTVRNATDSASAACGIHLDSVHHCTVSGNNASGNYHGIYLYSSSNNNLTGNIANVNNIHGIWLDSLSNNNTIMDNTADNNFDGVSLFSSINNTLTSNTAKLNTDCGIMLLSSSNNMLTSNTASSNSNYGIYFYVLSNNILTSNTASNNRHGIHLFTSSNNNLTGNIASNNSEYGIILDGDSSNNNTLTDNIANSNNYYGIYLMFSSNNTLTGNTANANNGTSIYLQSSSKNSLSANMVSNNSWGILLYSSSNNNLTSNTASNNSGDGIYLYSSSNNNLTSNTASNNDCGIRVYSSSSNMIANNTMVGDGIIIEGDQLQHWNSHSIDASNTVNGKPVYYWKDRVGGTVPLGAGQVIIANCTNVVVENQNVSNGSAGIWLGFSSNNTIANNTASYNNDVGIDLRHLSNNNTLTGNTANSNEFGISLYSSSYNILTGNTANSNNDRGISLYESSNNNNLTSNTASNNEYGILLFSSNNNNTLMGNNASNNSKFGIWLYSSSNNTLMDNTASNDGGGFRLESSNNNTLTANTASNNSYGIYLESSSNNTLAGNTANSNDNYGIRLSYSSNNNTLAGNTANSNDNYGIVLDSSNDNHLYNNYFDNANNARDDGNNLWNISKNSGTNIIGGSWLGGNYWSDFTGTDADGDGLGDTPYDIPYGTNKDYLPLVAIAAPHIFDTGEGSYPSISGTFTGTIKPSRNLTVSTLYTYNCKGTGGHTKTINLYENTMPIANGTWSGYQGDWHNITFTEVTLLKNHEYRYVIVTGSYPQIIHEQSYNATGGVITCSEFVDINGKRHEDGWIPAIRLS